MRNRLNNYTAKTLFGLEDILAEEIQNLGGVNIKKIARGVQFQGDKNFFIKQI